MPIQDYVPLGRLAYWRRKRRLTAVVLSRRTGITRTTISRLEHGKQRATYRTQEVLAEALGVAPEDLAGKAQGKAQGKS
jgi:transcriptional regulator with XRE-family HTH domain